MVDGSVVISSCLGGQLRVWDSLTGQCLLTMQRKAYVAGAIQNNAVK